MTRIFALAVLITLIFGGFSIAQQTATTDRTAILAILDDKAVTPEQFTSEFLVAVPIQQIQRIIAEIKAAIGHIKEVQKSATGYTVTTATHTVSVRITLDPAGRIAGLFFHTPEQNTVTLSEAISQLEEIEGDISYLIINKGKILAEHQADAPLAVGSAFKLGVLALLDEAVQRGDHKWSDVVLLEAKHISLPSGILQDLPVGSPITLHTAAALMISKSDNTATDLLMDVVGHEALAKKLDIEVALTTREFFVLKGNPEIRQEFLAASNTRKKEIARKLDTSPLPTFGVSVPHHIEGVEWYVSARRLCTLMSSVAHLDVMAINSGVATTADWQRVAYKGGSETGVLNFTTQVTDQKGASSCVVLTINTSETIAELTAALHYSALLKALLML